jgi:hypothetical protein
LSEELNLVRKEIPIVKTKYTKIKEMEEKENIRKSNIKEFKYFVNKDYSDKEDSSKISNEEDLSKFLNKEDNSYKKFSNNKILKGRNRINFPLSLIKVKKKKNK